jgi:integrase
MSRRTPSYCLHKASGQAVVRIEGRDCYLGKFGTPQSHAEYDRLVGEWLANGRRLNTPDVAGPSVNEVMLAYVRHVETYYVKDGRPTSEVGTIKQALRFVKRLYGDTPARDFGPLCLKVVRDAMVRHPITRRYKVLDPETGKVRWAEKLLRTGLARRHVNKQVSRVKRLFAWAVGEQLVPVTVYQALTCIEGLKRGKGQAREKPRIKPVPDASVEAVLPHVPPAVRTMIEVQRLCGCRPQDIVRLRACDIDMADPVWEYRPPAYKTEHHNDQDDPDRERVVYLGPKAQALLKPYLTLNLADYLFSPKRSEDQRNAERREGRKTPLWPSHLKRRRRGRRRPDVRDRYDVGTYRQAVRRGCEKAGVPVWVPLQLRHSRGTEVRKRYGLEASQAVLGHRELGVTQVYAEVDQATARKVMAEIG